MIKQILILIVLLIFIFLWGEKDLKKLISLNRKLTYFLTLLSILLTVAYSRDNHSWSSILTQNIPFKIPRTPRSIFSSTLFRSPPPSNFQDKSKYEYESHKNVKHSRKVSESTKKWIAASQGWKCGHCHNLLDACYEIDHIQPLYQGGSNDRSNLRAMCRNCHGKKTLADRLGISIDDLQ